MSIPHIEGTKILTPVGQKVVDFLYSREDGETYIKGRVIARCIDEQFTNRFRALLTDLVEREWIDACAGRGYRRRPERCVAS